MKKIIKKISIISCIFLIYVIICSELYAITTYDITRGIFEHVVYSSNAQVGENAQVSTAIILGYIFILLIYWLILLVKYEKEEEYYGTDYLTEEEIFKKYNPLMAGCIAQNRNVLSRDIIAVILNLANKGIIKLDILRDAENENGYKYMLYRIRKNEHLMDNVEKEIHSIIFEFVQSEKTGVDLVQKLSDMPKMKESYERLKNLDDIAKEELNKIGANNQSVPILFRIYNVVLFLISIILCIYHIKETSFNIEITISTILVIGLVISLILVSIPLVIAICYSILKVIGYTKRRINKINERWLSGQKIVSKQYLLY